MYRIKTIKANHRTVAFKIFRFFILAFMGAISLTAYAQPQGAKLFIIKVKNQYANLCTNEGINYPGLNHYLTENGLNTINRLFTEKPITATNGPRDCDNCVNISLIYQLEFNYAITEPKFIATLYGLDIFEYIEPQREIKLLSGGAVYPNDPSANPNIAQQSMALNQIRAYEAWGVTTGDTNVIIGVVDTGIDFLHPDLNVNVKYNYADPINGFDDDNNGFIDDYNGWNFAQNNNNPRPLLVNENEHHGKRVSGICAANTNNGEGVAGVAYNCKYLPVKIGFSGSAMAYRGVVYAADNGAKVINCSWGGTGAAYKFEQDIINYATYNRDATVVAAAGNDGQFATYYPASYNNVLSCAHMATNDMVAVGVTNHYYVDIAAPGQDIFGITTGGGYGNIYSGSSYAAPFVAGAVALVRAKYPDLDAQQAAELIRVNAANIYHIPANFALVDKIGKGRLDIFAALNKQINQSVRAIPYNWVNTKGFGQFAPGDTALLQFELENILEPISAANISVSVVGLPTPIQNSNYIINSFSTGQKKISLVTKVVIPYTVQPNTKLWVKVTFTGANNYSDYQYFELNVGNKYAVINANNLLFTVGGSGRLSYNDTYGFEGEGVLYKNQNLMWVASPLFAISPSRTPNAYDNNGFFKPEVAPTFFSPPTKGVQFAKNIWTDTLASASKQVGVLVEQENYAFNSSSLKNVVFVEYLIKNIRLPNIIEMPFAMVADFDIPPLNNNRCYYDSANRMGICYNPMAPNLYAGVVMLNPEVDCFFAIDHLNDAALVAQGNINVTDGFTDAEKYLALNSGIGRRQAGFSRTNGNDVSFIIGTKINNLAFGAHARVGIAFVAADSEAELKQYAQQAIIRYRQFHQGRVPNLTTTELSVCRGEPFAITPTGGKKFNLYNSPMLYSPIATGNSFTLQATDSLQYYITNIDSIFEGQPATFTLNARHPKAKFIAQPETLVLSQGNTVQLTSLSLGDVSRVWDFGNGKTDVATNPTATYTTIGQYPVKLICTDVFGCTDTATKNITVVPTLNAQIRNSTQIVLYPNPTGQNLTLMAGQPITGAQFVIYDLTGKIILYNEKIIERTTKIDLSGVATGIYQIKITAPDGAVIYLGKIIKE